MSRSFSHDRPKMSTTHNVALGPVKEIADDNGRSLVPLDHKKRKIRHRLILHRCL